MNSDELQKLFSSNLKNARNRANLSQLKLAEKANLSLGYICDLEGGRRWGTPETFSKLANALEINAYELLLPQSSVGEYKNYSEISETREYLANLNSALRENINSAVNKAITDSFSSII
ncbi:MAG: helix-turn-helix domain-containing protein [Treponema sp.]|nr:helix-turn-helix domain-containing protein [Treponema sp.]